jgi:predicted TIM-barrel fold metal-dependent hydrolase
LNALHEAGIRGCRFHFVRHLGGELDFKVFNRVVAMIAPLNWHAEVHFDAADLAGVANMLKALPVRYVIDHMGRFAAAHGMHQPSFRALTELLARDEKCWVKMSGFERTVSPGRPLTDTIPLARKIVEAAPDRVIWGTDWPHPNVIWMPNDGDLVDLIPLFAPERELQQKILVDNPALLFDF